VPDVSSRDSPPPAAALCTRDIPNDLPGAYDPRIDLCVIVSFRPDPACVKVYHAMHDIAVFFGAREEYHVSALDVPVFIREDFKEISRLECGPHAGARVGDECRLCLGHLFQYQQRLLILFSSTLRISACGPMVTGVIPLVDHPRGIIHCRNGRT